MSLYWRDATQRSESKSYEKLMIVLKLHLDSKRLERNKLALDRGRQRITPAPKSGKGKCHQWEQHGKCYRGADCSWVGSHTIDLALSKSPSRGRSPGKGGGKAGKGGVKAKGKSKGRPRSATAGERPNMGTSLSRKKNAPASHGQYWHPPVCEEDKNCAFLHQENIERNALIVLRLLRKLKLRSRQKRTLSSPRLKLSRRLLS